MMMNKLLMKYFASPNFLILMKWSWTMLTKVANNHFKVYAKNAFDEWCKLQGYDTKNSYHWIVLMKRFCYGACVTIRNLKIND
jgi:hypothetical protein